MRVTVTTHSSARVTLSECQIVGDSLLGVADGRPKDEDVGRFWNLYGGSTLYYVSIPLESIQKVEVRRFDAGKTVLLALGLGLTAAVIVAAATSSESEKTQAPPPPSTGGSGEPIWSCPLIYSWDGLAWRLDSGTYSGAIMPALARTDVDNLEHAVAKDGLVRLRLTGLPGETEHVNALTLLAVDHDPVVTVAPDGRGNLHTLGEAIAPSTARDFAGRDALKRVTGLDEWCWESVMQSRDPSSDADLRDGLEIEFPRDEGAREARLVLDGTNTVWAAHLMGKLVAMHGRETQTWYDAVAADPAKARRIQAAFAREAFLHVSVWGRKGWERQGAAWESGPELLKRQVVTLDLSRVVGNRVRVRLESTPNLWLVDRVAIDYTPEGKVRVRELRLERARDLQGRDLRALLKAEDGMEYVIAPGDTAEIAFRDPAVPAGQRRSYVARTTGWYRVNVPEIGEPQTELLERLETEPGAVARFSTQRMNEALAVLGAGGR